MIAFHKLFSLLVNLQFKMTNYSSYLNLFQARQSALHWVADGLRCSVLSKKGDTKREKEEEEVEGGKASQTIPLYAYVDICDSGLLPHIRLKDYKAVLMEGRMDLKQG